ncbi:MAG: endonuclease MutS2, partial [Bacteroidota bacterium]
MELVPNDFFEKIEFDKLIALLKKECLGELGVEKIDRIQIETRKFIIERKLKEVWEYTLTYEGDDRFPIATYTDVSQHLRMLELVDYVLPEEGLREINVILRAVYGIFSFFTNSRQLTYPTLYDIIRDTTFDPSLMKAIERVIDEKGQIRPDASPELMSIRKRIHAKQQELEKQFRSIINKLRKNGWLTDSVESFRNGRRVLSVPSEHKRKIKGIIHDESTTGKTAFIEPEAIIEINNDIFDLETEERREIYRILKELSALLHPYVPVMRSYQGLMVRFDVIQAKARLARKLNATMPKIVDRPHLGIIEGYHPLLLLKNQQIQRKTIPFTLTLFGANRILVLSGPNAGGKSITMKSVGLLQLMFQAGMLVPVDPESEFGIFEQVYGDIGDSQSLEDDLSTYSSRLRNMRLFLEGANDKTLILIDEFGSGTDPKIGGAIAEAILKELNRVKVFGVITTHYSNLKMYAYKNKGIVNGSMTFNQDDLAPTYELKVGRPGSSYAFEIAQKSGLQKKVLNYAKHKAGKNEKAVDELLIDLQREKKEVEEQLVKAKEREKKLEKLIKNYENLHRDLE